MTHLFLCHPGKRMNAFEIMLDTFKYFPMILDQASGLSCISLDLKSISNRKFKPVAAA
jgi:hypothetical protein